MMRVSYIWSEELQAIADKLPANIGRSSRVHSLIRALGLVQGQSTEEDEEDHGKTGKAAIVAPDISLGEPEQLRKYHDARYVEYLLGQPSSDSESDDDTARSRKRRKVEDMGLEHDCPRFDGLGMYARLVAASTLTACRALVEDKADIAIVWDGGRHHAQRAQASGFCYVADAVLGILYLSREGIPSSTPWGQPEIAPYGERDEGLGGEEGGSGSKDDHQPGDSKVDHDSKKAPPRRTRRPRILYLDFDLHYGDGVAAAFASPAHYSYPLKGRPRPPQVLTLSVHHASRIFFPPGAPGLTPRDTPHPFSLSYPLAAYAGREVYERAWSRIERVASAWEPDYVVLQLGVDGLPRDPVGMYGAWSLSGPGSLPWIVQKVKNWGVKLCVLGGGGYVNANAARAWSLATAVLVGRDMKQEDDVPNHEYFDEYAPSYTLEVDESNARDETTPESLEDADAVYETLASRIREIVALHA